MLFKDLEGQNLNHCFEIVGNGTMIQNKTDLTMRDYQLNGRTVAPIVDAKKFRVQCGATELQLSVDEM